MTQTVVGAVSSLRGADNIRDPDLHRDGGDIKLIVNGNELSFATFPMEIITNTITGLVSSLKGVESELVLDESDNMGMATVVIYSPSKGGHI